MQSRDPFAASAFPLKVNHLNKLFTYLSMYSEYLLAQKSRNRVEGLEECRYEHEHLDDGIVWQIPPIRQGKNPFPDTGEVRKCCKSSAISLCTCKYITTRLIGGKFFRAASHAKAGDKSGLFTLLKMSTCSGHTPFFAWMPMLKAVKHILSMFLLSASTKVFGRPRCPV